MDLLQQLKDKFFERPDVFSRTLHKHKDLATFVDLNFQEHPFLTRTEKMYLLVHDLNAPPSCEICNKPGPHYFLGASKGYSRTCSKTCGAILRANENREAYGQGNNPLSLTKAKQTNLNRYGCENPQQNLEIRKKTANTNMERYGVANVNQCELVKEKRKINCQNKYGKDHYFQTHEFQQKSKQTSLNKYGVEFPRQCQEIKLKVRQTMKERYGFEHVSQIDIFQEKRKLNELEKHGRHNHGQRHWSDETFLEMNSPELLAQALKNQTPLEYAIQRGMSPKTVYDRMIAFGISEPQGPYSTEKMIANILNELGVSYHTNDRTQIKPKELDFWIPSHNLAIEVCGLQWHSETFGNKNSKYHVNKWQACAQQGITLLTVFEDELNKTHIIQSRIKQILGMNSKTCGARQCLIKQIDVKSARTFVDSHHIQGHCNAQVYLGAFFMNELVAVMSFGRRKITKQQVPDWEMIRFCVKGHIPGIANKLFNHFVQTHHPDKVISYADLRWGSGSVYEKLGFSDCGQTNPNYWYIVCNQRKHRFSFTKKKLVEMGGDPKLTERENAQLLGLDRIWDCGNKRWVWSSV